MNPRVTISHEQKRLILQEDLDAAKSRDERNKLGQFATPGTLANQIITHAGVLLGETEDIRFLDPAIGTGSFYSALRALYPIARISAARGYEIDRRYAESAICLWKGTNLELRLADFTREKPEPCFNMLICNPPYVRHHHIANEDKIRLRLTAHEVSGVNLSGLSGLYCYFIALAHGWMSDEGVAGWLVPSEFMDVNYGKAIKQYLLTQVTLLQIHRFDPRDVQFADALVSSSVVWFRKAPPPPGHNVKFTYGGTFAEPTTSRLISIDALTQESKWTRFPVHERRSPNTRGIVSDFFKIKRGIATGDNDFFILPEEEIERRGLPLELFRPILPSPRYVKSDEVESDPEGVPCLEKRLFLLDSKLAESEIERRFPELYTYLQEGRAKGLHERYLCRHRSLWYAQEARPPAPVVCTYLGRVDTKNGRPFRFILNKSKATIANVYLAMYPTTLTEKAMQADPTFVRRAWEVLNRINPDQLLSEGRVYGGGLHKLEPKELANVPVPELMELLP